MVAWPYNRINYRVTDLTCTGSIYYRVTDQRLALPAGDALGIIVEEIIPPR